MMTIFLLILLIYRTYKIRTAGYIPAVRIYILATIQVPGSPDTLENADNSGMCLFGYFQ